MLNDNVIGAIVGSTLDQFAESHGARLPSMKEFRDFCADCTPETWLAEYASLGGNPITVIPELLEAAIYDCARDAIGN